MAMASKVDIKGHQSRGQDWESGKSNALGGDASFDPMGRKLALQL